LELLVLIKLKTIFAAMSFYSAFLRPLLFRTDPEKIHYRVASWLRAFHRLPLSETFAGALFRIRSEELNRKLFGLDFPNPVGLAAGFDKNAELFNEMAMLGFGFVEIGTVTPMPQAGNEKPRMFRLNDDQSLINRMGFNNDGADAIAARLKNRSKGIIIGGNIGKNKITPNDEAIKDYEICYRKLYDGVDYFVVNVSSPNTPGLRELQDKGPLLEILNRLQQVGKEISENVPKPLLLKIAPDLTDSQLDEIIEVVLEAKLDGIVATNTTVSRENLLTDHEFIKNIGGGGISGKPLAKRSTDVIRYLATHSQKRFKIIGVGGIHSPEDAVEKIEAGADLIQLYTGFIYEGPGLVKRICRRLIKN
jgi:dihydroorotate dehydrogenase